MKTEITQINNMLFLFDELKKIYPYNMYADAYLSHSCNFLNLYDILYSTALKQHYLFIGYILEEDMYVFQLIDLSNNRWCRHNYMFYTKQQIIDSIKYNVFIKVNDFFEKNNIKITDIIYNEYI